MMGSKQIYKDSPKLQRDGSGKMTVPAKKHQSSANTEDESAGHEGEPVTVKDESAENHMMMARHNLERHQMHALHEHEHASHMGGDKKGMHERHQKAMKDLHKKHEDEMGSGREDAMTKGAKMENSAA